MQVIRRWNELRRTRSLDCLSQGARNHDMANVRHLGHVVRAVAARLTLEFGNPVSWEDVIMEVLNLKDRYVKFLDFIRSEGVRFDEDNNKVRATRSYMARFRGWRVPAHIKKYINEGEPLYRRMVVIFDHEPLSKAEWVWIRQAFIRGENNWMTDDPLEHEVNRRGAGRRPHRRVR